MLSALLLVLFIMIWIIRLSLILSVKGDWQQTIVESENTGHNGLSEENGGSIHASHYILQGKCLSFAHLLVVHEFWEPYA